MPQSSITVNAVVPRLKAQNAKQLRQALCRYAAKACAPAEPKIILDAIKEEERHHSSAIGNGMALIHAKPAGLDQPYTLFARLPDPVDYNAADGEPVDLVFLMLTPPSIAGTGYLHRISAISRLMRNDELRRWLRGTEDSAALYALLTDPQSRILAA